MQCLADGDQREIFKAECLNFELPIMAPFPLPAFPSFHFVSFLNHVSLSDLLLHKLLLTSFQLKWTFSGLGILSNTY